MPQLHDETLNEGTYRATIRVDYSGAIYWVSVEKRPKQNDLPFVRAIWRDGAKRNSRPTSTTFKVVARKALGFWQR